MTYEKSYDPSKIKIDEDKLDEIYGSIPEVLRNLYWANDEMYYVDDEGNKIDKPVDMAAVRKAMQSQLADLAPNSEIIVNGVKKNRHDLLDEEINKVGTE